MKTNHSLIVQKFGGTSVADFKGISACANVIQHHGGDGQVIVVISAVKGVTDLLEAAIDRAVEGESGREEIDRIIDRERAIMIAMEEQGMSTPLGTIFLEEQQAMLARRIEGVRLLGQCPDRIRARILASGEGFSSRLLVDFLKNKGVAAAWSDTDVLPLANED